MLEIVPSAEIQGLIQFGPRFLRTHIPSWGDGKQEQWCAKCTLYQNGNT